MGDTQSTPTTPPPSPTTTTNPLESIQREKANLESQISNLHCELSRVRAEKENLESQISNLRRELSSVQTEERNLEAQNLKLKDELSFTKEKLEETAKKFEGLELDHKKLQKQSAEAEKRCNTELKALQEALQAHELKSKEHVKVKVAFDRLSLEFESSKKKMGELEKELLTSASEARKFEELYKQSSSLAESETKRALDFEKKLASKEARIDELSQELDRRKASESQLKEDISALDLLLSSSKEDLRAKLSELEDTKLKLQKEVGLKEDIEAKLKSLEQLYRESAYAVTTANQKNVELEDKLKIANTAIEEAKSQFKEMENRCAAAEERNVELEQQIILAELKSNDTKRELEEFSGKVSELNATLQKTLEARKRWESLRRLQEYEEKIAHFDSELVRSTGRNSELEAELKSVADKCAEHEGRANTTHQRNRELEDLMLVSHSKVEETSKKVSDLELLLETEKCRIQELEEQISTLEKKCVAAEAESKKHSDRVSELEAETKEKEKELSQRLNSVTEEKSNIEDVYRNSIEKLAETENLLEVLRNELNATQQKLESIENNLNAAGLRESEVMEKLKSAEEQLEQQGNVLEQATARSIELESLYDTLKRDSELKLEEATGKFVTGDSEAQTLNEKLKALEDQLKSYEGQIGKPAESFSAVKEELDQVLVKLASSETVNEDLKKKILEAEDKAAHVLSENQQLMDTNMLLKNRVSDLEELLNSAHAEKDASVQQLVSHMNTITELSDQHSRASELQSATEARISETEAKLQEAIQKFTNKESEGKELMAKLHSLEALVKTYEEQAHETATLAETQKMELEQSRKNLTGLEGINSQLKGEVASIGSKLNDLEAKVSAVSAEKSEAVEELKSSNQVIDNLKEQLSSEGQKLQLQEENNLLNETHQASKKELQSVIAHLEEQLKEIKSSEDSLKSQLEVFQAEIHQKSELQSRIKELEDHLASAEAQVKKEKEAMSNKGMEQQATLKSLSEELQAKSKEVLVLQNQVKELEEKLQQADAIKQKDIGGSSSDRKDDVEVKSRDIDIGQMLSTPTKPKSKKKSEVSSTQPSSSESQVQHVEGPAAIPLKFILGVALISVILGIILGVRKYFAHM
ncbi:uncharacterized protein LOC132620199 [Lycium barbarum]|uniref:uncharacterized protein LOC132620199 n=1 Tax=Lycium barbarum TaxID=112863 RepID=UPI00293F23F2|nr:uncharacterized protein LOC132620199 [Lycium barbarum]